MVEENNSQAGATQGGEQGQQVEFSLQRLYLKDLSFEAPQGAAAFQGQWQPKVNQDLATRINRLEDDHYEVVLNLTITVKDDDKTFYLVEVHQAGIFRIKGIEGDQLAGVLNTNCPNILFPYARETIDNVVTKGSFPALMLPPVNFDALFRQAVDQARAKNAEAQGNGGETPAAH